MSAFEAASGWVSAGRPGAAWVEGSSVNEAAGNVAVAGAVRIGRGLAQAFHDTAMRWVLLKEQERNRRG